MKILITQLPPAQGSRWQVQMDQHAVTFRTEREAQTFALTLQTRLAAPHELIEPQRAVG